MASAIRTRDHEEIRRWVEERGGIPTIVDRTGGLLRVDFVKGEGSGGREERLCETDWEEWFGIFDDRGLEFLHVPDGKSRFFKLVYPADGEESGGGNGASEDGQQRGGKLDINRASAEELDELFGVGPAMARRIVEDRERNGPFRSPGDLTRVNGIDGEMAELLSEQIRKAS